MKAILFALAVSMAVPAAGQARVWTVGAKPSDFPLIALAVAGASSGDVIRIRRGVYREDVIVDRTLTIIAEDGAVLFGTGVGTVIRIEAPNCEIRGLTIDGTGSGVTNEMDAAIQITSNGNRVVGNRIRRAFYGIVVAGATGNTIERNTISGLASESFGHRGDGIYLYRAPGNRVIGNVITSMRDAIYLQYAPGATIEANVGEDSRYGMHDMFSDRTRIAGNTFRRCSAGANLMNSAGILVEQNDFVANRGVTAVGLAMKECDHSRIVRNHFVANGRALQLDGSAGNDFEGNRFAQNDTAVRLLSSAEGNVFARNQFVGNWSDVVATGGATDAAWTANGVGNQWSAYAGFDFDGDGIGDLAHPLAGPYEHIEAVNATARLFLQSPAAEALALVARLSPAASAQVDPRPLVNPPASRQAGHLWLGLVGIVGAAVTAFRR